MKVVVVKFAQKPPLTPLLVSDASTLASLLQQWQEAAGISDPHVRFRTVDGDLLHLEQKVEDLPWISGYSSVEIVAERFLSTVVTVGGRAETLDFDLAPNETVAELKARCRRVLECGERREMILRTADSEAELDDELEVREIGGPIEVELLFHVRVFAPGDSDGDPKELKVPGSHSLSELLGSKDERLVWRECMSSFGKGRRCLFTALGPQAGELASAPAELQRLRLRTVNFLTVENAEAKSESREVWPTALASSLLPEKRKDLQVWRNSELVSGSTFASLRLSPHEFLLIDAAIPLLLRGLSTERLQVPASCKVMQLRQRLETSLQVAAFELFLPNGKPLTPESALLTDLGPPAEVEVRAVKLKVQITFEGAMLTLRSPIEVGASAAVILAAAAEILEEELPANTLIACTTCGRTVQHGGEGLPLQCCSARIRRLTLTRLLDIKLLDGETTSHLKVPSTSLASDVLAELALAQPCRLLHDGKPLAAAHRLLDSAHRNRLQLSLERRIPVLVDLSRVGGGPRVAVVWPSEGVAALEVAGVASGDRFITRAGGVELDLEGGTLADQGVKSGEVLSVFAREESGLTVPNGEAAFRVICYEWNVPNFDLMLALPPSVEELRIAVNTRFLEQGVPLDGSRLVQLQAMTDNGELALCTVANTWVLCSGEKVPMRRLGSPFFRPLNRTLPYAIGERIKIHLRGHNDQYQR